MSQLYKYILCAFAALSLMGTQGAFAGDNPVEANVTQNPELKQSIETNGVETAPILAEEVQPEAEIETAKSGEKENKIDVTSIVLHHLGDSYEWEINIGGFIDWTIPFPIIVYGQNGWSLFSSAKLRDGGEYNGFHISADEKFNGKIVEFNATGEEVRPKFDISITKNVFALLVSSLLLIVIVMSVAKWYKRQEEENNKGNFKAPKGFVGFMEMFIMSVNDDIIMPSVGKQHRKFAPYLLTAFFFIFFNNILGLIPIFPMGANLTGNIAITCVLAVTTFLVVNIFGTREYWKEILWPDVPVWLKFPLPIMPLIEIIGMFTKPFALMVRLFANILAGHSIILGLVCLIFITANMGAVLNGAMTGMSVLLSVFISLLEILVAYIQAYVFTMLSAVFIGLAQAEPHGTHEKK